MSDQESKVRNNRRRFEATSSTIQSDAHRNERKARIKRGHYA